MLTSDIPVSTRELCKWNLKNDILAETYNDSDRPSSPTHLFNPEWERSMQRSYLQHLYYPGMNDREAEIPNARISLFKWILESTVDTKGDGANFRAWLANSSESQPLFWIKGKPGSGKSTLMKSVIATFEQHSLFGMGNLTENENPTKADFHLFEFGCKDNRDVNFASFFFNGTGPPIRRSPIGLLRSMILQILTKNPGIVPSIAPARWEAFFLFDEDPKPLNSVELRQMLLSIFLQRDEKSNMIIFIDALDECETYDNHLDIFYLLHKITACPGVKVCISSRSLPHFLGAIGSAPSLILENCAETDIQKSVIAEIEDQLFITKEASIDFATAEKLIHELISNAAGCFLWVTLVFKLLRVHISERKEASDLLLLVSDTPRELNELFRSLLTELDESEPSVASTLHFLGFLQEPVSLLRLSLMGIAGSLLHENILSPFHEEVLFRIQECGDDIVSTSKGLLQLCWPERQHVLGESGANECGTHIRFVHRTVRDFLVEERTAKISSSNFHDSYGLVARYCATSLFLLKTRTIGEFTVPSVLNGAIRSAYAAMFTWTDNEEYVIRILDELDYACNIFLEGVIPTKPGFGLN
jgi:hypothetical protein